MKSLAAIDLQYGMFHVKRVDLVASEHSTNNIAGNDKRMFGVRSEYEDIALVRQRSCIPGF